MFDFFGVHLLTPAARPDAIAAFIDRARSTYDLIITIPLTDEFLDLATSKIDRTFDGIPIVKISNIYFSGLHPDLTYVGGLSQRILGPLGDYHSRLALFGFLQGMSLERTKALFCGLTYHTVDYYGEYATSMAELRQRDRLTDVAVSAILGSLLPKAICLFSVNHPSSALLAPYCTSIVSYLEGKGLGRRSGLPDDPSVCAETLAGSAIFPIYPEIAAYHGMAQIGSHAFKAGGTRTNPMGLDSFIAAEFDAFQFIGAEILAQTPTAKQTVARFTAAGLGGQGMAG